MSDLAVFIDNFQQKIEELTRECSLAYWDFATHSTEENQRKATELGTKLDLYFADANAFQTLKTLPKEADPDLERVRKLLIDSFASRQIPEQSITEMNELASKIEAIFSGFRAKLNGVDVSDNDLKEILISSGDSDKRKKAWEASKLVGAAAEEKILKLVKLRNVEARRLGYDDYFKMQIALQELDEKQLFDLFDRLEERIEPIFKKFKAKLDRNLAKEFSLSEDELRPWHYADPFFQEAPAPASGTPSIDQLYEGKKLEPLAIEFYKSIGLPIDRLIKLADLYERPLKSQHAFCATMGQGTKDIRVLCNLRSNAKWMDTILHEFGHALYDEHIDDSLPYFLKSPTHIFTTEAIAQLMGRFSVNVAWLKRYAGASESEAKIFAEPSIEAAKGHLLVFTQWVLVMSNFERDLYANPDQDLNTLWWDYVEKYQMLHRPDHRNAPDWAAKIHLASSPVYYHNYLLGEMLASQLLHFLRTQVSPNGDDRLIADPETGKWLSENIFAPGARYPWNELIEKATGESLNPDYFVEDAK
jgi:peptidyl-dipeptidase A